MTPPSPADIQAIPSNGDGFIEFFKWMAMFVVVAMLVAAPIMHYIRKFNSDKADNAKDEAEKTLFQHMSKRVEQQQAQLDKVYTMYNDLVIQYSKAEGRLQKVEEYEKTIVSMKQRLEEKDSLLLAKDEEIKKERDHNRLLSLELLSMKDRLHQMERTHNELERRLAEDERQFCMTCSLKEEATNG